MTNSEIKKLAKLYIRHRVDYNNKGILCNKSIENEGMRAMFNLRSNGYRINEKDLYYKLTSDGTDILSWRRKWGKRGEIMPELEKEEVC